jgi:hypothetical protein
MKWKVFLEGYLFSMIGCDGTFEVDTKKMDIDAFIQGESPKKRNDITFIRIGVVHANPGCCCLPSNLVAVAIALAAVAIAHFVARHPRPPLSPSPSPSPSADVSKGLKRVRVRVNLCRNPSIPYDVSLGTK